MTRFSNNNGIQKASEDLPLRRSCRTLTPRVIPGLINFDEVEFDDSDDAEQPLQKKRRKNNVISSSNQQQEKEHRTSITTDSTPSSSHSTSNHFDKKVTRENSDKKSIVENLDEFQVPLGSGSRLRKRRVISSSSELQDRTIPTTPPPPPRLRKTRTPQTGSVEALDSGLNQTIETKQLSMTEASPVAGSAQESDVDSGVESTKFSTTEGTEAEQIDDEEEAWENIGETKEDDDRCVYDRFI